MKNIMLFEENKVELINLNGEVYFNPYDVAKCLGLGIGSVRCRLKNMTNHQVCKLTNSIVAKSHNRKLHSTGELFLTESGVYKLAFRSNKPNAEKFTDWVTDEVLPSVRRTGKYEVPKIATTPVRVSRNLCCDIPINSKIQNSMCRAKSQMGALTELLNMYDCFISAEKQDAFKKTINQLCVILFAEITNMMSVQPKLIEEPL